MNNRPKNSVLLRFEEVFRFVYQLSVKIGGASIVYAVGARFLAWLCRQRWAQRIFLQDEVTLIQKFLSETKIPIDNPATVIQLGLMSTIWRTWSLRVLRRVTPNEFERWITVIGLARFQKVYQKGKGVILVQYHSPFVTVLWPFFDYNGFDNKATIGALKARGIVNPTELAKTVEYTRQLHVAKKTLEQGGLVRILPDDQQGHGGIPISFYNRRRYFKTGFAELALRTGSPIIPVFVTVDLRGQFKIEFLEPLDVGVTQMKHEERVEMLVKQYVALFEKQWAKEPGNIDWGQMKKHIKLPILADDKTEIRE